MSATYYRGSLCSSSACCPLLRWAELWMDEHSAGRCSCPMWLPHQLQEKKWHFYFAGPLDGEIVLTFLGCKMDPGSWAGALESNEAYQACYLQEIRGDDSDFVPLFASDTAAPLQGGFAEPSWGPTCFWGDTLQNWLLLMSPPLRVFCGVEQHRDFSVGPVGAHPTASPCMHPAASHGRWEQGIHISTNFWTSELPWPTMALWAGGLTSGSRQRQKAMCDQGLPLLFTFCWCQAIGFVMIEVFLHSGRNNSCMVTPGLMGLKIGDQWLWGRVIHRMTMRRFGRYKVISKLQIKDLCPNMACINSQALDHFDLKQTFWETVNPFSCKRAVRLVVVSFGLHKAVSPQGDWWIGNTT